MAGKYEGTALGLSIGCFGELPAEFSGVYTSIARSRAVSYVARYDLSAQGGPWHDPKEAPRTHHVRGYAAIFAWSDSSWTGTATRWPAVARRLRHARGWRLWS